jgi:hypothetical protein
MHRPRHTFLGGEAGWVPESRWLSYDPTSFRIAHFSTAALLLNIALAVVILVSTGFATDRWASRQPQTLQISLRGLLFLMLVVSILFATLQVEPSFWESPLDVVTWLLLTFLVYGFTCTALAGWTARSG